LTALDNALAESLVDSYKTELIADRVWRSRAQLELATVQYIGWFNHDRLHSALGYLTPVEHEHCHHRQQTEPNRARTAIDVIEGTIVPAGLSAR
jgi:putative transposase